MEKLIKISRKLFPRIIGIYLLLGVFDKFIAPYASLAALPSQHPEVLLSLSVGAELLLGSWLLLKPDRLAGGLGIMLLATFIGWSFLHLNATDCGCFANLGLHRSPTMAIFVNLAAALLLCFTFQQPFKAEHSPIPLLTSILGSTVILCLVQSQTQATTAKFLHENGDPTILLKISPTCEACQTYTAKVLQAFPKSKILAITFVPDPETLTNFFQTFHIPIIPMDLDQFAAFDHNFSVPRGYNVFNGKLSPLAVK